MIVVLPYLMTVRMHSIRAIRYSITINFTRGLSSWVKVRLFSNRRITYSQPFVLVIKVRGCGMIYLLSV